MPLEAGSGIGSGYADLGVTALLDAYRRRAVSPVGVMRAVIDRVERCEPSLKALYAFDPEAALRDALDAETRWVRGEARALEGIPVTLKENIATRGTPMPLGTAARPLDPMPEDAPP